MYISVLVGLLSGGDPFESSVVRRTRGSRRSVKGVFPLYDLMFGQTSRLTVAAVKIAYDLLKCIQNIESQARFSSSYMPISDDKREPNDHPATSPGRPA